MNCISYNKSSVSRLQLINNAFIPRNKAKQFLLKQFTTSKNISVLYFFTFKYNFYECKIIDSSVCLSIQRQLINSTTILFSLFAYF